MGEQSTIPDPLTFGPGGLPLFMTIGIWVAGVLLHWGAKELLGRIFKWPQGFRRVVIFKISIK
jgi:hypothetical protein